MRTGDRTRGIGRAFAWRAGAIALVAAAAIGAARAQAPDWQDRLGAAFRTIEVNATALRRLDQPAEAVLNEAEEIRRNVAALPVMVPSAQPWVQELEARLRADAARLVQSAQVQDFATASREADNIASDLARLKLALGMTP